MGFEFTSCMETKEFCGAAGRTFYLNAQQVGQRVLLFSARTSFISAQGEACARSSCGRSGLQGGVGRDFCLSSGYQPRPDSGDHRSSEGSPGSDIGSELCLLSFTILDENIFDSPLWFHLL